jgi:hypothetical protein
MKESDLRHWFSKEVADKLVPLVKKAADHIRGSELTALFSDLDMGVQRAFLKRLIAA